jgi:hypothetical protein
MSRDTEKSPNRVCRAVEGSSELRAKKKHNQRVRHTRISKVGCAASAICYAFIYLGRASTVFGPRIKQPCSTR